MTTFFEKSHKMTTEFTKFTTESCFYGMEYNDYLCIK